MRPMTAAISDRREPRRISLLHREHHRHCGSLRSRHRRVRQAQRRVITRAESGMASFFLVTRLTRRAGHFAAAVAGPSGTTTALDRRSFLRGGLSGDRPTQGSNQLRQDENDRLHGHSDSRTAIPARQFPPATHTLRRGGSGSRTTCMAASRCGLMRLLPTGRDKPCGIVWMT